MTRATAGSSRRPRRAAAREVVGCSASGVIAGERELEDEPGVAVLALRLPAGSLLRVQHVVPEDLEEAVDWPERLGLAANACTGLILLADPFTTDVAALIGGLERDYPGCDHRGWHGDRCAGRAAHLCLLRFQSCRGWRSRTWPGRRGDPAAGGLTGVRADRRRLDHHRRCRTRRQNHRRSAAYQVLAETIQGLDAAHRQRANGNLLVGLAMDEYRDEFKRGDFLIRNLMGVDRTSGAIAVAGEPRIGQTLQFQIRDSRAADEELRHMLHTEQSNPSAAALLFACNGRGTGLFGAPDHDARTVRELLGPLPLAGLFCNGEIGPSARRRMSTASPRVWR